MPHPLGCSYPEIEIGEIRSRDLHTLVYTESHKDVDVQSTPNMSILISMNKLLITKNRAFHRCFFENVIKFAETSHSFNRPY